MEHFERAVQPRIEFDIEDEIWFRIRREIRIEMAVFSADEIPAGSCGSAEEYGYTF